MNSKGWKDGNDAMGDNPEHVKPPTLFFLARAKSLDAAVLHKSGRVLKREADGRNFGTIVSGQPRPDGIDISHTTQRLYWTNMGDPATENNGSVMSAKLDGSDVKKVIAEGGVHTPKQIVIDHEHQKLYFCDREGLRIHRCDMDGENHEVIVQTGDWTVDEEMRDSMRWCVGITVDAQAGKLYWTQKGPSKGGKGRIYRAGINMPKGDNAANRSDIELLFDKLPEPIDLEIVPETQILYWTDRGNDPMGNTLNQASVSEENVRSSGPRTDDEVTILARHFHELIGMKIDSVNQHIYLTDLGGSLYRYDMDCQAPKVLIEDAEDAFTGIGLIYD